MVIYNINLLIGNKSLILRLEVLFDIFCPVFNANRFKFDNKNIYNYCSFVKYV